MISLLTDIVEIFENIPQYILYALESLINLIFTAIEGWMLIFAALLPHLPEPVAPPSYLGEINWFFPVGTIIGIATPLLAAYVVFLGIRWLFNKIGEL